MEGLAKIYSAQGKLQASLREFEGAAAIRRKLQAKVPERELFQDELKSLENSVKDVRRRQTLVNLWQKAGSLAPGMAPSAGELKA